MKEEHLRELKKENEVLRNLLAQVEQEKVALYEQVLQTREEWEAAFNAITDRVFVEDANYSVLRANTAVLRDYRLTPGEIFGRKCHQVFRGQDEPCSGCPVTQTLKTGKPAFGEMENPRLKGSYHLRASEERFRRIVEHANDGILAIGEEHRIILANKIASEITGYPPEDLFGLDFNSLFDEENREYIHTLFERRNPNVDLRVCCELEILTAGGEKKETEVCFTAVKDRRGQIKTYAYLRDISVTERIRNGT